MKRPLWAFVVLTLAAVPAGTQAPPIWGDLQPGPWSVGLRVDFLADSSRAFGEQPWRPIRAFTWYPAAPGAAGPVLRIGDLLALAPADPAFAAYAHALRMRDSSTTSRQFAQPADSLTDWITAVALLGRRDAPPAPGQHPLVLYSLGLNDYQVESVVLWEYLASQGYVVVVVPLFGPTPGRAGLELTVPDLRIQRDDLVAAWNHARQMPFVDGTQAAVVGHSAGAIAGMLLADVTPAPVGLVSLDGSIASPDGVRALGESDFSLARVRMPMLTLFALRQDRPDLAVLNALGTTQYRVGFGTGRPPALATHFDFQSWPLFGELRGIDDPRGVTARPSALGAAFYRGAVRLTAAFLDHVMRGESDAMLREGAVVPGIAPDLLRFEYRDRR